jgi:hypothetical protein
MLAGVMGAVAMVRSSDSLGDDSGQQGCGTDRRKIPHGDEFVKSPGLAKGGSVGFQSRFGTWDPVGHEIMDGASMGTHECTELRDGGIDPPHLAICMGARHIKLMTDFPGHGLGIRGGEMSLIPFP